MSHAADVIAYQQHLELARGLSTPDADVEPSDLEGAELRAWQVHQDTGRARAAMERSWLESLATVG